MYSVGNTYLQLAAENKLSNFSEQWKVKKSNNNLICIQKIIKFDQVLASLIMFTHVQSSLIKCAHVRSSSIKFTPVWSSSFMFNQVHSSLIKLDKFQSCLIKFCQFQSCLIKGHIFCTEIKILNPGSRDIFQKLRQTKCFQFLSDKIDQNTNFAKSPSAK